MKLHFIKKISLFLCIIIISTTFFSCKNIDDELNSGMNSSNNDINSSIDEKNNEENLSINPLTGKTVKNNDFIKKRPVAIMINNIKISLPQRGISKADVMYELPVEGGITRMMAVFSDYTKVPQIGSVRSSRHDFLELALPIDAIYVHFGGSKFAYNNIKKYGMDTIDGIYTSNTAFLQDTSRLYMGREHTWFTDYDHIKKGIEVKSVRTKQNDNKVQQNLFNFATKDNPIYKATKDATNVKIYFSNYAVTSLDYDKKTKLYTKGIYGSPQMDSAVSKPMTFTNGFILFAKTKTITNYGHQDINLNGGTGYYITNGKYNNITWSKKDEKSNIEYFNANGTPLVVNPGKSYVAFVPKENKSKTTFTNS